MFLAITVDLPQSCLVRTGIALNSETLYIGSVRNVIFKVNCSRERKRGASQRGENTCAHSKKHVRFRAQEANTFLIVFIQ